MRGKRVGAKFTAELVSAEALKVRDELVKRYGSLDLAAHASKPRMSYSTLRGILSKGAKGRGIAHDTILAFESLGITRERLLSL